MCFYFCNNIVWKLSKKGNIAKVTVNYNHLRYCSNWPQIVEEKYHKLYGNTKDNFIRVLQHQIAGDIPITYKLGTDDVLHIVCDETDLYSDVEKVEPIKNRIFSMDQNPNYLGWSVIDWKDDYSFNVVASGVISLKAINDLENNLKEAKLP